MHAVTIGALSRETGVKVPTIRFYEQIGLLPVPPRTDSNRRIYGAADVKRLRFIRHARDLGFGVDAIRQLLTIAADDPERPCDQADAIARKHLVEIDEKIGRLVALRAEIQQMVRECSSERIAECRVIEVLSDHGECRNVTH
jgi:DNA-binding transcriptional MerR regulator